MNLQDINILVSLANQKGGVAKSTATTVLANAIHYRTDLDVCICDLDRQQSIYKARQEDLQLLANNELNKFGINNEEDLFPVRSYTGGNAMEEFRDDYLASLKEDYNIIFLDVPGSLDQDFLTAIGSVDLLIVPSNLTSDDMNSTMDMLDIVEKRIEPIRKEVIPKFFFPTKVDTRTSVAKQIEDFSKVLPIPMLGAHLPHLPGLFGEMQTYTSYENLASEKDREKKKVVLNKIVDEFIDKVFSISGVKL